MPRRLRLALGAAALLAVPAAAHAHLLDHAAPTIGGPVAPLSTQFNSGGENAEWELVATLPTANPHSDLDFFSRGGETYASVGSLGIAANGGGQNIIQLTQGGKVAPKFVANAPTAACVSDPSAALGLQHDVEATPKGSTTLLNTDVPGAKLGDAQLLLDATDAAGRCHDQGIGGIASAPQGGLEIIDVTDPANPVEIGLTSHIGEAHTVNVDPRRPHIAYAVTSDSVGVDENGKRDNEESGNALDGFEVVDLRSCLTAPLGTVPQGASVAQKRELCRPQVFRYRYPSAAIVQGHTNKGSIYGCHELEVYPDDRMTCGSGSAMIVFDLSKAFDDKGNSDPTDDTVRGASLPCAVRPSSTVAPSLQTGAMVTDCVVGKDGADLSVSGWLKAGAPSVEGIEHVGSAFHMGRESATGALQPAYPSTEDIDFDHEAELTDSRRFVLATDERGGGVTGGAQCTPGADLSFANGGIHAYAVDRLSKTTPSSPEEAFKAYARTSTGAKAIFRAPVRTPLQASFCTAHVFQQIPGENRIFMGWYSQGTQVVDFTENPDGTLDFKETAYFVPENANQWVSAIFKVERNPDGTSTYYGATGDGILGTGLGRNGIDVYKVTLPAAPKPAARIAGPSSTPGSKTPGITSGGSSSSSPGGSSCTATAAGFRSASVRPSGRGLRFGFSRASSSRATVEVFQDSRGSRLVANKRVARFTGRAGSFTWNGRGAADGTYLVRLRVPVAGGRTDVRRFAVRRVKGRFVAQPSPAQQASCGLLRSAKLSGTAWGGRKNGALGIAFRVAESAQVTVRITRGGKTVRRFGPATYDNNRLVRLRLPARGRARGLYRVVIDAKRGQRRASVTLASRKV